MLTLPIKKQWFDLIASGEKKEEYRQLSPYWKSRLLKYVGETGTFRLRNGYSPNSPAIIAKCEVSVGTGREEWGAEHMTEYFILSIKSMKVVTSEV